MTGSGASGGRGRVKDREATAKRRWGSRFSSAATGIGREAPGSICRRKWWGPAVLEAVSRSEEHTSELQSLMRIQYAVFCLKTKKQTPQNKLNVQEKNREKQD